MEIALNTLLVTFFIQLKVNGKRGKEPATTTSFPCTLITPQWLAIALSPRLPYIYSVYMCPYQYLRLTYIVQMSHRLNNRHDTAGHT